MRNKTKCNNRKRQHDTRPEDTNLRHLWLNNYGERTSTSPLALVYPLFGPSCYVRAYSCMPQSNPAFSPAIYFAMKRFCSCSAVLRHSPSSWAVVVHWWALMPKAPKTHPIHSFSCPPTQPRPPTNSPNITHFGTLVSSMRATNPANKIRLLRKVASMLSFSVLLSVSR